MDFGVGAGWNREEMRNMASTRAPGMKLLAERLGDESIWTDGSSSNQAGIYGFSASSLAL